MWERKKLTFEHLPPNKAFNFTPAKPVNGGDFIHASDDKNRVPWDLSGLKYQNQQREWVLFLCAKIAII